ncbi:unnamed protein product [Phytophthora fragariaefolia]|uniref:Unnamed protein product n=1 Tax=Phytophthora fragariaefolia TaxID=1490495 RepID=A0A9W6U5S3_9STRA|nr:unnamed protein product [Phytophthora fragariaefolia]
MEKPAAGWFLHWSSTTRAEELTWLTFREHAIQHYEASNYQAVLREKFQRLRQTGDIETYNGEYSALIFRVEGMSTLDQVMHYTNGLKSRTKSYVRLENPETLSETMDLAVKYEVTHFIDDVHDRQSRQEKKKPQVDQPNNKGRNFTKKPFRGKGRFKPSSKDKSGERRTCYFCNKPGHIKTDCFLWKKEQSKQKVCYSKHVVRLWSNNDIRVKALGGRAGAQDYQFSDKNIRVKLGDNQIVEAELEVLPLDIKVSGLDEAYKCVAVVYAIPDGFDCILGIPFFEDMQPQIHWRGRRIEGTRVETLRWERTGEICGPIEEGGPVIASGFRSSVEAKGLSAKRPDSCRGAALETDVKSPIKLVRQNAQSGAPSVVCGQLENQPVKDDSVVRDGEKTSLDTGVERAGDSSRARGKDGVVEKMFTMGVVDETGVQTKYITRKKLRKFLRLKTKTVDEPDFMLVLSNETIKQVARSLQRRDQPDNVRSTKAQRYLETDWESFRANPAAPEYSNDTERKHPGRDGWSVLFLDDGLDVGVLPGSHARRRSKVYGVPSAQRTLGVPCATHGCLQRTSDDASVDLKDFSRFEADEIFLRRHLYLHKSRNIDEHLEALRKTLDILRDNKLYVKLAKCVFCAEEIPCLGDFVGRNGVRMDPDKVQTIKDWPVARTQEELHSFLGLTGNVQRFCPEYAALTATMFALLKKNDKHFSQPMHLRTDASKFAVGGVLFQVVDEIERPIAYTSRKMKAAELNYPRQQQELLAIVHALAAFRIYCLDKLPIVETDHKSLEGLFTQKMANRRLARWYDILAEYQPTFSYLPGTKNGIADALSRRPDLQPETKFFHDLSVTSFNNTSFSLEISEVTTDSELVVKIKKAYKKNRDAQVIFMAIKRRTHNAKPSSQKQHRKLYRCFSEANGLLWYQSPADETPRIVVPNEVKLRQTIISECHDSDYGGHPGTERTYLTLARHWYWSRRIRSIQKFIADCEPCRRNKPRLTKPPGLLEPLSIPDERWRSISMDFITDLPRTKREDDWDIHLANAEFAVNSTVHSGTKLAPFEADLGYIPLNPLQLAAEQLNSVPSSRRGAEFHELQAAILLRCRDALAHAQERMRDVYDRNRKEQVFEVGDRVYLSTQNLDPKHTGLPASAKFGPKWIGPYTVVRKIHNHAYELNIQTGNKLHPVFNTGSLKPYHEPTRLSRPHDVVLADGSIGQVVKRLLGSRTQKRRTQFLVEWVGEEKPTWEPVENLNQIPDLIADFDRHRRAKRRRR